MSDKWIDAVSRCIIAISESLNQTEPLKRSVGSEMALGKLTDALVAAGKEAK